MDLKRSELLLLITGICMCPLFAKTHCDPETSSVPSRMMPNASSLPNRNVGSDELTAMVNARGYFFRYDVGFITFDIKKLVNEVDPNNSNIGMLVIMGQHSQLTVQYIITPESVILSNLNVMLGDDQRHVCNLEPDMPVTYSVEERFSCTTREIRSCFDPKDEKKRLGELVMESLDIELGGDPAVLGRGDFSKPAMKDGCGKL